jgi:SAM-dependent methyltransferase
MTEVAPEMLLADRRPFHVKQHSRAEVRLFEDYVLSRERYKDDLLETLEGLILQGPVLEFSGGFGTFGLRLAQTRPAEFHIMCGCEESRAICEERRRCSGLPVQSYRTTRMPLPRDTFELAYSINLLHEWEEPTATLGMLHNSLKSGGALVINDLRRDSNPYITEYIIREMAEDSTETGRHHLSTFLASLQSAYTLNEFEEVLHCSGFKKFSLIDGEAMTVTAIIHK